MDTVDFRGSEVSIRIFNPNAPFPIIRESAPSFDAALTAALQRVENPYRAC
jgi:hypothetical protein